MIKENRSYTIQEAADVLRLNRQTIYNAIRKGKIRVPKVGRVYRMTEEQLQEIRTNGWGNNQNK